MGNAVVGGSAYATQLFIIASWLDGAIESGNWHVTQEVIASSFGVCAMLAVHLTPLWKALMKKMFGYDPYEAAKMLAPFALIIGLAACSSTPKSDIAALEVSLTTADIAAKAYVELPRCVENGPVLCSDDDIVSRIGSYRQEAYTAVVSARAMTAIMMSSASDIMKALEAAQTAVSEFAQIVAALPKGS